MKGFSITLCFGKYAGFYVWISRISFRICLGFVAFTVYWTVDLETYIEHRIVQLNKIKGQN